MANVRRVLSLEQTFLIQGGILCRFRTCILEVEVLHHAPGEQPERPEGEGDTAKYWYHEIGVRADVGPDGLSSKS